MKILKHFLLTLLTASICIFLSPVFALNTPQTTPAQTLYQAGKYAEAINVLKQAVARFQRNGDRLNAAMTLSNLSLAYQQLGQWQAAETAITQSLNLLAKLSTPASSQILAQALDVQGRLQLSQGHTEAALNTWQAAAKIYQQLNEQESLIRNQINQAQALQSLGFYLQANKTLISVEERLNKFPDSTVKATGFLSLGNIRRLVGNFKESEEVLQNGLDVAKRVKSSQITSDILLSLGNTSRSRRDIQINLESKENKETAEYTEAAINYYQQAIAQSATAATRINAQLNLLSLLIAEKNWDAVSTLLPEIKSQLADLPVSRTSVYAKINFAQSLIKYAKHESSSLQLAAEILAQAVTEAQNLKDQRGESYALGTLGEVYQKTGQLTQAEKLTQQALAIAQSIKAEDIAYQWLWHLGGILEKQKRGESAIAAYQQAWKILKSLRTDLIAMNQNTQFSFRENVEPVYRDFVDILLKDSNSQETNLKLAREVIESLQLAEIDNFLRSSCLRPTTEIDKLLEKDNPTAVIYPIILEQRLEVIVKLPSTEIRHYTTNVSKTEIEETISQLRENLPINNRNYEINPDSEKIYTWLIQPVKTELDKNQIKTLVFVLDGALRNIPMSVLYDKEQQKYLFQNYAIALTPGLQLVDPKPLKKVKLNALVGGIGAENLVDGITLSLLENVKGELEDIRTEIPQSQELFNEKLTKINLENQVKSHPFSVVHLATHGQFSSNPEQTYIAVWQDKLKINELDNLLRTRDKTKPESIELLVLSACKTAKGDKQAALGLAGIAVKSGARSTLASLWVANDESTKKLMSEFYKQLNKGVTKAEALQRAQLSLFAEQKDYPDKWAPYILVGNWL